MARTTLFGFREDVAIRVTPARDGSRVDMRSASRYGFNDFGANARRVRAMLDDIDDAASSAASARAGKAAAETGAEAAAREAARSVTLRCERPKAARLEG